MLHSFKLLGLRKWSERHRMKSFFLFDLTGLRNFPLPYSVIPSLLPEGFPLGCSLAVYLQ